MKYWLFFAVKLAAIWGIAGLLKRFLQWLVPIGETAKRYGHHPFSHDLAWTTAMMAYTLICVGLVYLAILDQKYRCRACVRRLRMPVNSGSWDKALIFAPPKVEYICPYGHGTMSQRELQISGRQNPDWVEHKDLWEELESYGRK
jgi:hypothetical protein